MGTNTSLLSVTYHTNRQRDRPTTCRGVPFPARVSTPCVRSDRRACLRSPSLLHSCFQWTTNPQFSIIQVVSNDNDLGTLASALQAADLAETLGNENATLTVFAPANPAFENVDVQSLTNNPDLLRDLLNFHVVQGGGADRQRLGGTRERHDR
ncbi:fasciclin domain-containing protein [Salinibacter ruber]|uniref:fasciclin domain-containing protein n=1 Tax=Salinibacter ruber TaxID=146919 RepID=UPI0021671977